MTNNVKTLINKHRKGIITSDAVLLVIGLLLIGHGVLFTGMNLPEILSGLFLMVVGLTALGSPEAWEKFFLDYLTASKKLIIIT